MMAACLYRWSPQLLLKLLKMAMMMMMIRRRYDD
jgi:hypothetical protein